MVLGGRTKSRRSPTVQLDYLVHVQEVKPWPPSQSLKTLRSVLIQWENGDRNAGSTKAVVPNLGAGVSNGKIEFNETFRIPVTLVRDRSVRGRDGDAFQKNYLELNFYEPRRDKTVKGQLLGTANIDLAVYGNLDKESVSVSIPVNSQRSFSNTAQPLLFMKIQPIKKSRSRSSSSLRDSLSKEASMDRSVGESVSALMNEEYAEEAETASMTDDDVSSQSSLAVSSSAFESNGGWSPHREEAMKDSPKETYDQQLLTSEQELVKFGRESVKGAHESLKDEDVTHCGAETNFSDLQGSAINEPNGSSARVVTPDCEVKVSSAASFNQEDADNGRNSNTEVTSKDAGPDVTQGQDGSADDRERAAHQDNGHEASPAHEDPHSTNGAASKFTQLDTTMSVSPRSDGLPSSEENIASNSYLNGDKLNRVKSVRSPVESFRSNGSVKGSKFADLRNGSQSVISNEMKDTRIYGKEIRNIASDNKIQQLEIKLKMLEGELREAAAIEVGLYSVVAEHGSSVTKLHAPARRLSRLYLHACKESSQSRRGHAARSAVSGLVLVAKACGNDVPRLTFWLSNSIVLRAIIGSASTKQQASFSAAAIIKPGGQQANQNKPSSLKWKEFSPSKDIRGALSENTADWNDPCAFTSALEKIEAWIFSRIIESVWWQTLTPHMQSTAAKSINTSGDKTYRDSNSDDQDQLIFSLELWKKAFKDACERLCPVRAAGHDCGCLPVLARLIMEQCVARLDVAMFNAILRESGDEIPTDPVSDPVSDAKVLPIQAGKASFGAGAQLKNAIGNWSRWLTDLFGIDDDDLLENEDNVDSNDERKRADTSSTCFRLLNALSDLMMLPKDMLLSRSIRKEVCPAFAAPMIRRVLDNFVPDEFCPDLIPAPVLEALDSEDPLEAEEGTIANFPCNAAPIVYSPPSAASVAGILSDDNKSSPLLRRSGSSVLKKSHTSDDELDEFESPLAAIVNGYQASSTPRKPIWTQDNGGRHAVRYQLLREVWMNSE